VKAEIPEVNLRSETLGSDPMAIYKPSGAKIVDAAKAMANFTGWTFAAVNAIASEVQNIQLRLYRVDGEDHTEVDDHVHQGDEAYSLVLGLAVLHHDEQPGREGTALPSRMRWTPLVGQFGGLDKLGSGCRQAANSSIPDAQ
jgi:hypothetical protein